MAIATGTADGGAMSDINTTPLIDVMLVLLIMFIITIPIQTHAVKVDTPQPAHTPRDEAVRNLVTVDRAGTIFWNGARIDLVRLRQYLDQTQLMTPIPELHVRPAPDARYEVVDQLLAVTKRAHVAKMGFVNNEAYSGL